MRGFSQGGVRDFIWGGHVWFHSGGMRGFIWGGVCGFIREGGMRGFIRGHGFIGGVCMVLFRGVCMVLFGGRTCFFLVFSDTMRCGQ